MPIYKFDKNHEDEFISLIRERQAYNAKLRALSKNLQSKTKRNFEIKPLLNKTRRNFVIKPILSKTRRNFEIKPLLITYKQPTIKGRFKITPI